MTRRMSYILLVLITIGTTCDLLGQWIVQSSGTTVRLADVAMLDSTTAICVGDSGRILKTTNAGLTWLTKFAGIQRWNEVASLDQNRGLVVGNGMAAASTTDGGESWTSWSQTGVPNLLTVAVIGMTNIFMGTDSGVVMYSYDEGTTWGQSRLTTHRINSIFGSRGGGPTEIYAATPYRAYRTTSLGSSWTFQTLPIAIPYGEALRGTFAPDGPAYIVGYEAPIWVAPFILRRRPTDTAWTRSGGPELGILRDVCAPTSQLAFACGSNGLVLKTINGGNTWDSVGSGTRRNLNAINFVNERCGFAVGDSGTILFTPNGGLTAVNDPAATPERFELFQNFPNPFNPETRIQFALQKTIFVTLKVHDLLGEEVSTLVNEEKPPGMYDVTWHADGRLASGVYFYKLVAGGFLQTRKLLLLR
jgi:photosystem II stability/assembly factor-like uncharacterized protein